MSAVPAALPGGAPGTADLLAAAGGAVALGARGSEGGPANGVGAGFLALVQQALADGPGTPAVPGTPVPAEITGAAPATVAAPTTDEPAPADVPQGTDLTAADAVNAALLAGLTIAAPVLAPTTAETVPTAQTTGPATVSTVDAPAANAVVVPLPTKPTSDNATGDGSADTGRDPAADPAVATPAPAASTSEPTPNAPAPAPATSPTSPVGAPTAVQAATPVTAAPAITPADGPRALDPVTTQVVDKITSMVDRGTGTHRVTMKLNPEQLGEVRIVMTVRDGAVHVRLAASEHQAHQALLDGSPELNRLLEAAGTADARITVREAGRGTAFDLGQGSSNGWASPGSSTPDQGAGSASGGHQDQHAGTRAEQDATDGTHHNPRRFAAGPTGARSDESVTSSRATGLDVTM